MPSTLLLPHYLLLPQAALDEDNEGCQLEANCHASATTSYARSLPFLSTGRSLTPAQVAICFLHQLPRKQQAAKSFFGQLASPRPPPASSALLLGFDPGGYDRSCAGAPPCRAIELPGGSWGGAPAPPPPSSSRHVIICDQRRLES